MKYICLIFLFLIHFKVSSSELQNPLPISIKQELIRETSKYLKKFNSPLNAQKLVESCIKHKVPVSLALAQGQLESCLGAKGQARKNYSVWGVGAWCSNAEKTRKRTGYKSFDDSIEPYIKLVRKYIDSRGYPGVLDNFSRGKLRYAQDPNYETKLKRRVRDISKNTQIRTLYLQLIQ